MFTCAAALAPVPKGGHDSGFGGVVKTVRRGGKLTVVIVGDWTAAPPAEAPAEPPY